MEGDSASISSEDSDLALQRDIEVEECRACSGKFRYRLNSGGSVTILAEGPRKDQKYKAVSYVWGKHPPIPLRCRQCGVKIAIQMRCAESFERIMSLAGSGSTVWLDALSINQADHSDIAAQVAVMGNTYKRAQCVSVLLPPSDTDAFLKLSSIFGAAQALLSRKWLFELEPGQAHGDIGHNETGKLARTFFSEIDEFHDRLEKYRYWSRAWTFQEWACAYDIEVTVDNPSGIYPTLKRIKSVIVYGAIMVVEYKLRQGQYAEIDVGFVRGFGPPKLELIKRLFPFEDVFAYHEEFSEIDVRYQTIQPNIGGLNKALGLHHGPIGTRSEDTQLRARLNLMLDAFSGLNEREATYEADIVCCWASMCNLSYGYSKNDSINMALTKVIRCLRRKGIKVFNFQVQHAGEEIDLSFFSYSASQRQCNATNGGFLRGAPVFTGRVDTGVHFCQSIANPSHLGRLFVSLFSTGSTRTSFSVLLRKVLGANVTIVVPMLERDSVLEAMNLALSGQHDEFMLENLLDHIKEILEEADDAILANLVFVVASIPLAHDSRQYFHAWAICRGLPQGGYFVARESQNGTLVLAYQEKNMSQPAHIAAYLTISDHQSGTYLLPVSATGDIDLTLPTPQRSDILIGFHCDRYLRAKLLLGPVGLEDPTHVRQQPYEGVGDAVEFLGIQPNDKIIICSEESYCLEALTRVAEMERPKDPFDRRSTLPPEIDIGHPNLISPEENARSKEMLRRFASQRPVECPF
ncbi:heterokaryon incompatibility protein-domain-containing protein [Bisporella sp. PMI_857]|nr:heterokaryon incompatibility protein-domain-containing protein [Bisporella sp. PMI_857]